MSNEFDRSLENLLLELLSIYEFSLLFILLAFFASDYLFVADLDLCIWYEKSYSLIGVFCFSIDFIDCLRLNSNELMEFYFVDVCFIWFLYWSYEISFMILSLAILYLLLDDCLWWCLLWWLINDFSLELLFLFFLNSLSFFWCCY